MGDTRTLFAYLGLFVFLNQLRRLVVCFWFHRVRPASYHRLLHKPSESYALITGSTDGIGKSLAKSLYSKGFNLILHGRNEEKMKKLIEEIHALHRRQGGEIQYFIADASESNHDFEMIAKIYEHLNITLLINNVGGSFHEQKTLDRYPEDEIRRTINLNLNFPLFLTHAFIPQLRRASLSTGPTEVVFVGSLAGDLTLPYMSMYGGSKAFLKRAASVLHEDERALRNSNLSFMYLNVDEVRSTGLGGNPSFLRPSADDFAEGVIRSLGCGRRVAVPWYSHSIIMGISSLVPEALSEWGARMKAAAVTKDIVSKKNR